MHARLCVGTKLSKNFLRGLEVNVVVRTARREDTSHARYLPERLSDYDARPFARRVNPPSAPRPSRPAPKSARLIGSGTEGGVLGPLDEVSPVRVHPALVIPRQRSDAKNKVPGLYVWPVFV